MSKGQKLGKVSVAFDRNFDIESGGGVLYKGEVLI
jgi:hypothetical protein